MADHVTEAECREIRERFDGEPAMALAREFGRSHATVYYHVKGRCEHRCDDDPEDEDTGSQWVDYPACMGTGAVCADCGDELPAPGEGERRCPAKGGGG